MTASTTGSITGLRTVRGPKLGVAHLLRLRRHPIEHNDFLREAYGDVLKLNVFGTTLYAAYGLDAAEQVLINRDRIFANGPAWSHFIGPFFRRGLMLLDFDEHLHHRGQLYAYLRAIGVVPPFIWSFDDNAPEYQPRAMTL